MSDCLYTNQLHTYMHLKLVWIMSKEVLVKVFIDEGSEWAKVRAGAQMRGVGVLHPQYFQHLVPVAI